MARDCDRFVALFHKNCGKLFLEEDSNLKKREPATVPTIKYYHDFAEIALKNILAESVDDILERPFELDLLLRDRKNQESIVNATAHRVKQWVDKSDDRFGSTVSSIYFPKNTAGLRKCAFIDIFDMMFYLTLVLCAAETIEKYRVPTDKRRVFSYRYLQQDDRLFDARCTFTTFRSEVGELLSDESVHYLVSTDIADFYDRLNIHRLESQLHAAGVEPALIRAINELLLHWSNRDSYGLPVGNNASRILAEAALADIDRHLLAERVKFVRFVDDFRLFAPDLSTAYRWLEILAERLSQDGLMLNAHKTRIRAKVKLIGEFKSGLRRPASDDVTQKDTRVAPITHYTGLFPRKFRKPSASEIDELQSENLDVMVGKLPDEALDDPKFFARFTKTVYAKKDWSRLPRLVDVTFQLPRFLPYVCDFLKKVSDDLSEKERQMVKDALVFRLVSSKANCMEYAIYSMASILGSKPFNAHVEVVDFLLKNHSSLSPALGCALIASVKPTITRASFIRLKKHLGRMTVAEQRQFLNLGQTALHREELRPLAKVLLYSQIHDPVLKILCRKLIQ